MRKLYYIIALLLVVVLLGACSTVIPGVDSDSEDLSRKPDKQDKCTTIQSGELVASNGDPITTGYDEFGYNYQARIFNGRYCDYDRVIGGDYCDVTLVMKWNDAWLSNKDCDGDGLLDRHYGYDSYIGSGAWVTNHQSGEYVDNEGNTCKWTYFVKIVAAPEDAYKEPANANGSTIEGTWFTADGTEIGPVIWGEFAIIQQVENDPCAGIHGAQYLSPAGPGLGKW